MDKLLATLSAYASVFNFTGTPWVTPLESILEVGRTMDLIKNFRQLGENWDGEGGQTFKEATIAHSLVIVEYVTSRGLPCPDVSPNPHGTIAMEWENKNGHAYVEVGKQQLTALFKATDRRTIFSLDRVDAADGSIVESIVFELNALLYPDLLTMDYMSRWARTEFEAQKTSNYSLVDPYEVAGSY